TLTDTHMHTHTHTHTHTHSLSSTHSDKHVHYQKMSCNFFSSDTPLWSSLAINSVCRRHTPAQHNIYTLSHKPTLPHTDSRTNILSEDYILFDTHTCTHSHTHHPERAVSVMMSEV